MKIMLAFIVVCATFILVSAMLVHQDNLIRQQHLEMQFETKEKK